MHETTIATRTGFQGKLLHVEILEIALADGARATREIIRHPGAAVVLGQLDDGRFVLVRQYRKAVEREMLEAVAGTLNRGEDPVICAHRELSEESGYRARELIPLGSVVPAPGYTDERLHLFYARLHEAQGALHTDADEHVCVVYLTAEEIERDIAAGTIDDAKTLAVWLRYRLWQAQARRNEV
ncbi:MAG: NUDIX hydrolase [Verrucomicrobia bacterium]|nr:NUDIX hydrolase [Verrucomicrobiota bacterium]